MNNANIPLVSVKVKKEFLRNLEDGHGEFVDGYLFGVYAQRNQALLFNVFLDTGAVYYRLPINAFVTTENADPSLKTSDLQLWDCLSNQIEIIQWAFLKDQTAIVNLSQRSKIKGRYLFTVEYLHNDTGELDLGFVNVPGEYKCAHIISLENGNLCAMPNNRIVWQDQAFVRPTTKHDYKINRNRFFAETEKTVEDSDKYFYETLEDSLVVPAPNFIVSKINVNKI